MGTKMFHYGAYKNCPTCGKEFFVPQLDDWVFKRYRRDKTKELMYFCKWSCVRKWDAEHPDRRGRPRKKHKEEFEK